MRRLILPVVLLLLVAGCNKPNDTVGASNPIGASDPKDYMAAPQILISAGHQYKDEGWIDEEVDFQADNISLQGNGFSISLVFNDDLDEEKLKEAVAMENFDGVPGISFFKNQGRTILYANYVNLAPNKKYSLIISDKLENSKGKRLKAPIMKEITLQPDTMAKYTVIGSEGTYEAAGMRTVIDAYAVGSMNLSSEPKTIAVDFSAEVDTASVEKSIVEGLKDKNLQCSFEWDNGKKLIIKLDRLKGGEGAAYCISMDSARDKSGNHVYKNLYFTTADPNLLGSIDIKDKSNTVLHKFSDKRYMVVQSPNISNSIILDDTEAKYVFDLDTMKLEKINIDREYILGIPGFRFAFSWNGSNDMLLLNRVTGQVIDYSTLDGGSKELFILPKEIMNGLLMGMSVSPDGSKLALTREEGNDYVYVFNMNGKLLYKGENIYKVRTIEALGSVYSLQWFDNDSIVLEDNVSTENKLDYNVIGININTGKKSLIAEHAYKPVTMSDKGLVKVEHFKDFRSSDGTVEILREGNAISGFKTKLNEYSNFFFVDENTVIYNTNDNKIIVKHLDSGESEILGNGYIIGLSQDKSKIYYMTNYKMLYYID